MTTNLDGLQVYRPDDETFVFRDKYYGRNLDDSGFEQTLRAFFFDGHSMRLDVIPSFIDRLQKFRAIVTSQRHFQFWASSLLFVYEGQPAAPPAPAPAAPEKKTPRCLADMRFIDFGQTDIVQPTSASAHSPSVDGGDAIPETEARHLRCATEGLVHGVDTLIHMLRGIQQDPRAPLPSPRRPMTAPAAPAAPVPVPPQHRQTPRHLQ